MKAKCHNCGELSQLEPFSGLCVDCLVLMARSKRQSPAPCDAKQKQLPAKDDE